MKCKDYECNHDKTCSKLCINRKPDDRLKSIYGDIGGCCPCDISCPWGYLIVARW